MKFLYTDSFLRQTQFYTTNEQENLYVQKPRTFFKNPAIIFFNAKLYRATGILKTNIKHLLLKNLSAKYKIIMSFMIQSQYFDKENVFKYFQHNIVF